VEHLHGRGDLAEITLNHSFEEIDAVFPPLVDVRGLQ